MKKILLLDILNHPTFSFVDGFLETINIASNKQTAIEIINPIMDNQLSKIRFNDYIGIIISGSITPYCTTDNWIEKIKQFIHRVRQDGKLPLLAICMTHELIAYMYGGKVRAPGPKKEIGTVDMSLTEAGLNSPIFSGFPAHFKMLTAHSRDVIEIPSDAKPLAFNQRNPFQSFQLDNLYCVQFHAEIDAATLQKWILEHGSVKELIKQGFIRDEDDLDRFLQEEVYDTQYRVKLFSNFIEICEQQHEQFLNIIPSNEHLSNGYLQSYVKTPIEEF